MSDLPDGNDDSPKSNRGRKLGCIMEEVNLRPGGVGGRVCGDSTPWHLDFNQRSDSDSNESDSDFSVSGDDEEDTEMIGEDEMDCISDLEGNRLLPIGQVLNAIGNSMCCAKCVSSNHKALMDKFVDFCTAYEDRIENEENDALFYSKLERMEWQVRHHKTTKELYAMYNGSKCGSTK